MFLPNPGLRHMDHHDDLPDAGDVVSAEYRELGAVIQLAFSGALEVYNIVQCTDYPPNGSIAFYNLGLYDYKWSHITSPAWTVVNNSSGLTPQCGYGGSLPQQLTLTY